jgi:hypothetical protein
MADWPPKKNTAFNVHFPIYDADGDLVSGASSLDSEISGDHGTFADCTNEATEIATSSGVYYLALTAGEMNYDIVTTITKTSTSGAKTAVNVMYTVTRQLVDLAFPTTSGRSLDVTATGAAGVDWGNVENPTTAVNLSGTNIKTDQVVASVTGAVGSVTGSVGSVTGAVGSVTGAVGSVTGAVGSVTGNVGGSVASIASGGIASTSFASGAITAAAIAADAIGASELAADAASEIGTAVWATAARTLTANTNFNDPTAAAIADAVWDEATSGHVGAGSEGKAVVDILAFGAPPAVGAIADAVMDEVISTGHAVANSLGKIVYDNVNAPIATVDTVVDTIATYLDTEVAAILADTNELQTDWANGGRLDLILDARASQTSVDTIDGIVDSILADTGTDGVIIASLGATALNAIADAILGRSVSNVEATAAITSLCTAILKATSRVRDNAGTLETYRTNGTTLHMSQTITTDASNQPIDELTVGV